MNPYEQAAQQSFQNLGRIQNAIQTPQIKQPSGFDTYLKSGVSLSRLKEEGFVTPIAMAYNFLVPGVVQDIANIPSNLIGGTMDIASGQTAKGLGRFGQGFLDLATTILGGGTSKLLVKGAQKAVLGGALKGVSGEALEQVGKGVIRKEVAKGALGLGGIGTAYGVTGALKDLDKVPENQRTEFILTNALIGGGLGALTGGLLNYATARGAIRDLNRIEQNVLKDIATRNYDELVSSPINKKGEYVIDYVSNDLKKASLEAIANQKEGRIGRIFDSVTKYLAPVKRLGTDMQNSFTDWVNTRNATGTYAFLKFKEFRNYVDNGVQGILDYEKDASKFPGVKKYFDDMHKTLVDAGILKQDQYFQEVNYLPFLYENSPEEVLAAFEKKRRLSTKPSFTFQRVIEGYNEGVALGLTPKFGNIAELIQYYEKTARKAIADRNFFNNVLNNRWVVPSRLAPKEWVELDAGFPRYTAKTKDGFIQDKYKAPPEFAQVINNYLRTGDEGLMTSIGKFFDGVKQRLLTAGIPLTGINFHGFSTLMRYTWGSGKNPFTSFFQGLGFMISPNTALKRMEKSLEMLPEAVKSGLIVSEGSLKNLLYNKEQLRRELERDLKDKGYLTQKFGRIWNLYKEAVEDPLMEKVIPAYKIETWLNTYNTYKTFMPDDVARKKAAEFTNTLLGGLNFDEMGRSKEVRDLMKFLLLAPDWFETNVNLGVRTAKSFWDTNKNYRAYRTFMVNFMGSYIFFNAINKAMSGKYMWENEPGQKFSIDTGTKDEQGNTRYIQIFGTGADFVRLPFDVMDGFINGDNAVLSRLARNRLSPLGSTLVSLYSNTDYAGRPLFGVDKYGKPLSGYEQALGATSVIGQAIGIPTVFGEPLRNIADEVITGKKVPFERKVVEAIDLPVRYKAEVSDITKLERERSQLRRQLEDAISSGDDRKAQELSKNFTDREISTLISNITTRQLNDQLSTREKLFNRLSETQKLELAQTNPEFAAMYEKISQLKAQQKTNPLNRYKDTLEGKPETKPIKAKAPKKPRRIRVKKVRARKVRTPRPKKLKAVRITPVKQP